MRIATGETGSQLIMDQTKVVLIQVVERMVLIGAPQEKQAIVGKYSHMAHSGAWCIAAPVEHIPVTVLAQYLSTITLQAQINCQQKRNTYAPER